MRLLKKEVGKEKAVVLIRQHITEYFKGIENRKDFTNSFFKQTDFNTCIKLLRKFAK
jgi:tRNA-dihydrouridine synthase